MKIEPLKVAGTGDCIPANLTDVLDHLRDAPYAVPGDWFQDEIQVAWGVWVPLRDEYLSKIHALVNEWQIKINETVRS